MAKAEKIVGGQKTEMQMEIMQNDEWGRPY